MADITLTGSGEVGPHRPGWSVSEDASPIAIGDSSGSVGAASSTHQALATSPFVVDNDFEVSHPQLGEWVGSVQNVSAAGIDAALSVTGFLGFLNQTVTAPPMYSGETLSGAFQAYVDLCESGHTIVWDAAADPVVVLPGWRDKCWVKLKELCAAYGVLLVAVAGVIHVRDAAGDALAITNRTPVSQSVESLFLYRQINVVHQNSVASSGSSANLELPSRASVSPNESTTVLINTAHSIDLVYKGTFGEWGFVDSTGSVITVTDISYYGLGFTVETTETPGQVLLTLTGPLTAIPGKTAPYTATGSVHVAGVLNYPTTLPLLTGAAASVQEIGPTINNPFIGTLEQAYDRGAWAADVAAGPAVSIRFNLNAAELLGFGLDLGSLVSYNDSIFRVTQISYGNLSAAISATRHVTLADMEAMFGDWTYQDMADLWDGYSYADMKIAPLTARRLDWLYPAEDLYPATDLYPGLQP